MWQLFEIFVVVAQLAGSLLWIVFSNPLTAVLLAIGLLVAKVKRR